MTERVKVLISNRQKDVKIPSGIRLLIRRCCHAVLIAENFHESAEISVSFVNNEQIRQLNAEYRQKDAPTDVLSFPMCDFETPGDFSKLEETPEEYFNPDTGELMLGDIVISVEKVTEQAEKYGCGTGAYVRPFASARNRLFNGSFHAASARLRP